MKFFLFFTAFILIGAGCTAQLVPDSLDIEEDVQQEEILEEEMTFAEYEIGENTRLVLASDGTVESLSSSEGNIILMSPLPGDAVDDILRVIGSARVFENVVEYRLKDVNGDILESNYAIADAPDIGQFGDFEIEIDTSAYAEGIFWLDVYWASARDGSDTDLISVKIERPSEE